MVPNAGRIAIDVAQSVAALCDDDGGSRQSSQRST
jgi:hypothetical protein